MQAIQTLMNTPPKQAKPPFLINSDPKQWERLYLVSEGQDTVLCNVKPQKDSSQSVDSSEQDIFQTSVKVKTCLKEKSVSLCFK